MDDDLCIRIQLQREEKVFFLPRKQGIRNLFCFALPPRLPKSHSRKPGIFGQTVSRTMTSVIGEAYRKQCIGTSIRDIVKGPLIQVISGRNTWHAPWDDGSLPEVPRGIPWQQRPPIDTMRLERQPMWSDIPFFKYIGTQPERLRNRMHMPMHFSTVTKHEDIGDPLFLDDLPIPIWQVSHCASITDCYTRPAI
ncbi:hypothetical protein BCEP27_11670 [Burkholderia cepacia]